MHSTIVHLYEGDADSWAINLGGDMAESYRARKGFGADFKEVWTLEIQSDNMPELNVVDWDAILERAIFAYDMNDPLLSRFEWPHKAVARK
ncbi:MAG: hypothetical protein ACK4UN_15620 [Limisphaerales bacterium]